MAGVLVLSVSTLFLCLALPICAVAQSTSAQSATPTAAPTLSGSAIANFAAAGGTQQQTFLSVNGDATANRGSSIDEIAMSLRARVDGTYNTAKAAGKDRVTSAEMFYGELRLSADAGQALSRIVGRTSSRRSEMPQRWLYGIASHYQHIAFDLDRQLSAGAGAAWNSVAGVDGLALAADLRYISQQFGSQGNFESWGARVHQSYTKVWIAGGERQIVFTESVELLPAFRASRARQVRSGLRLVLPISASFLVPISLNSDYMGNASTGFKTHYWRTTVGVEWTFES